MRWIAIYILPTNSALYKRVRSTERGHGGVYSCANSGGPPRRDRLEARVESDSLGSVYCLVAEERAFPTAEAMKGHRYGNGNVDTDHAGLHAAGKITCRVPVASE